MKKLLIIDNYDSFSYNLLHAFEALGCDVTIWRNDAFAMSDVAAFDKIVLSPGPGIPVEAGLMPELIQTYAPSKSMLGVCLGHQAIAEAFGGTLINLEQVYHGIGTQIQTIGHDALFANLPESFTVGRYHSWAVHQDVPETLQVTARDANGQVMALKHRDFDLRGIQFHPESILTPNGSQILQNWINT